MKRIAVWAALACLPVAAQAGEWQVDTRAKGNQAQFTSQVVGFTFHGVTDQVDGFYYWEGQDLFAGRDTLRFEVVLGTLDTGIGKRDRDMREVLSTQRWPKAVFTGRVAQHQPVDSTVAAYRVVARGTMAIHGVERPMDLPGTVVVEAGHSTVATHFTLRLRDFDIEAPTLAAFIKVSQEIVVDAFVHLKHVR
ncbi:MAG: YceI family protein [Candidatus Latescibacterota bacterium]